MGIKSRPGLDLGPHLERLIAPPWRVRYTKSQTFYLLSHKNFCFKNIIGVSSDLILDQVQLNKNLQRKSLQIFIDYLNIALRFLCRSEGQASTYKLFKLYKHAPRR